MSAAAGADVAAAFRWYLWEWYQAGHAGVDPVSALIVEAGALPPGAVPPRPDLTADAAAVLAWAEQSASYHARRERAQRTVAYRTESRRRQLALHLFAAALRRVLALSDAEPAPPA